VFLVCGQLIGAAIDIPFWTLFAGIGVLIAGQAFLVFRKQNPIRIPGPTGVLILAMFAMIGATGQELLECKDRRADALLAHLERGGWLRLTGRVSGPVQEREKSIIVSLKKLTVKQGERYYTLPGKVQLILAGGARKAFSKYVPEAGQTIQVQGQLHPPERPTNPGFFDYRSYLRSRGYSASMSCFVPDLVKTIEPKSVRPADLFQRGMAGIRKAGGELFTEQLGPERAALLRSMLFGESHLLPDKTRDTVVRTGLAHMFSVSGLHAGLIAAVVFGLLRLFGAPWRSTWILTTVLVWAYVALIGFRAPAVRAACAVSVLSFGNVIKRETDDFNVISAAALCVLLYDFRNLWRVDFQLSYVCLFAIIILKPSFLPMLRFRIEDLPPSRRRWAFFYNTYIATPIFLALASQIGLLPLLAFYFHQISLVSVFSNALILPFGCFGVASGFLLFVFGFLAEPLALVLGAACGLCIWVFEGLAMWLGSLRGSAFCISTMPWWAVGGYYVLLLSGCYVRSIAAPGEREKAGARLPIHLAGMALIVVCVMALGFGRGELMVRLLDVGQGDAIYVEFPTGENLLIDGGTSVMSDRGETVIVPYLRSRGIGQLSAVAATHPDADHVGGLASVIEEIPVGMIIRGPGESQTESYQDFITAVEESGAQCIELGRGDVVRGFPGATLRALNPGEEDAQFLDSNDSSLVLRLDYGSVSILFAADAEKFAEQRMLRSGAPLDCDLMTAGHHGSRTSNSDSFLDAVTPEIVLISCGRNNRYGHPHPETLARFQHQDATIYRTDQHGSVAIFTDGRNVRVETTKEPEPR